MKIEEIDKNFKIENNLNHNDWDNYNVLNEPFEIYGVFYDKGGFRRMDESVGTALEKYDNYNISILSTHTSGGRVRFSTNSTGIAVYAKVRHPSKFSHIPLTGSSGFDLYKTIKGKEVYLGTFKPPYDLTNYYDAVVRFEDDTYNTITINFPPYCGVEELYIGVDKGSKIGKPLTSYIDKKPIVYYGSSITQGGCASRPGNIYQNFICRETNCDYINLGFSGGAKAEDVVIDYIKKLDMSIFVYDYDYNAPNAEYLEKTHQKMFDEIRKVHPDIPIIMLSIPTLNVTKVIKDRRKVIKKTYDTAIKNGDKNVYFISGQQLLKYSKDNFSVDSVHPNDLGFYSMGKVLGKLINKILKD